MLAQWEPLPSASVSLAVVSHLQITPRCGDVPGGGADWVGSPGLQVEQGREMRVTQPGGVTGCPHRGTKEAGTELMGSGSLSGSSNFPWELEKVALLL